MTPRPHAELIKAWADGATIQHRTLNGQWEDSDPSPSWYPNIQYRIKPMFRYRLFAWVPSLSINGKPTVLVCSEEEHRIGPRDKWSGFLYWIGDWQEVDHP